MHYVLQFCLFKNFFVFLLFAVCEVFQTPFLFFMYSLSCFYYCMLCLTDQVILIEQVMQLTAGTACCPGRLPTYMLDQLFDCCRS